MDTPVLVKVISKDQIEDYCYKTLFFYSQLLTNYIGLLMLRPTCSLNAHTTNYQQNACLNVKYNAYTNCLNQFLIDQNS